MNAVFKKHVYSNKAVPHFAHDVAEATHRYRNGADDGWKYMTARTDREFLDWGDGWMNDRKPQAKRGNVWRNL